MQSAFGLRARSSALTAGPFLGGALIALVGWRSIFLVGLPIGLGGLWLAWRCATDTTRADHALDIPGQAAAIAMLGVLAAAIIEGGRAGWTNPWVLSGFVAFLVFASLFLLQERHAAHPMLPLSLFRHRMFALMSSVGLLVNIAFYGLIFVFSLYFQQVNHWTPFETGLAFVPMMGAVLPANLLAPRLAERIGAPVTVAIGAVIAGAGCLALLGIGRDELLDHLRTARCDGRGSDSGAADDLGAAGQCGKGTLRRRRGCPQFHAADRQRARRRFVRFVTRRQADAFLSGTRVALMISAALLICTAGVAIVGRGAKA